jgi:hypothetical protein
VSHPTPLHPDADLALVLDEMRQSVAAWGDEGMIMRVFRASICLMLLSILDTLIELLADFRAGRLPPVLPAKDEPARRVGFQPTIATKCEPADERPAPAASQRAAPSRPSRARRADDPRAEPPHAPRQSDTPAPNRIVSLVSPTCRPVPPPSREARSEKIRAGHPRQRTPISLRYQNIP